VKTAALQAELKAIANGMGGDPRNPDHPNNIRGKLNWLVIQVGGGFVCELLAEWRARLVPAIAR
jgi:hypothetical protein